MLSFNKMFQIPHESKFMPHVVPAFSWENHLFVLSVTILPRCILLAISFRFPAATLKICLKITHSFVVVLARQTGSGGCFTT
jgi:hypothetical protein